MRPTQHGASQNSIKDEEGAYLALPLAEERLTVVGCWVKALVLFRDVAPGGCQ